MAADDKGPFIVQHSELKDKTKSSWRKVRRVTSTWRGITLAGLSATLLILLLNICLLTWAVTSTQRDPLSGLYIVTDQECGTSSRTSTGAHLIINLFSTLLLGASNYCMQTLSSPTREEVDRAHSKGRWASIGIFSLRNFFVIPFKRTIICCVLALTSTTLAFVYNSVVIDQLASNSWVGVVVYQDIFSDGPRILNDSAISSVDPKTWLPTCPTTVDDYGCLTDSGNYSSTYNSWRYLSLFSNGNGGFTSNLTRLSVVDCVKEFRKERITKYRNVLLVVNGTNQTQNVLSNSWSSLRNLGSNQFDALTSNNVNFCNNRNPECSYTPPDDFIWSGGLTPSPVKVDHCLADQVNTTCQLGLSLPLLITVIVCNLIKVFGLGTTLLCFNFHPLATTGDALDSFLTKPDRHTQEQSSLSRKDVKKNLWSSEINETGARKRAGRVWRRRKWRMWAQAASPWRWLATILIGGCTWIASLVLLVRYALNYGTIDFSPSVFGAPLKESIFVGRTVAFVPTINAVIANIPQILVSLAYLFYNGILSVMCLINEYGSYATKRRGLRVSEPRGSHQRVSYFLSLPFQYSIPLICMMSLLHWAVSQALFPYYVTSYTLDGGRVARSSYGLSDSASSIGFSAAAIVVSLILGGIILLSLPLVGLRKYPPGFVIAGNCSAALSAACHVSSTGIDTGSQSLRYGVLVEDSAHEVRKLGFSHEAVEPLVDGDLYEAPRRCKDINSR